MDRRCFDDVPKRAFIHSLPSAFRSSKLEGINCFNALTAIRFITSFRFVRNDDLGLRKSALLDLFEIVHHRWVASRVKSTKPLKKARCAVLQGFT